MSIKIYEDLHFIISKGNDILLTGHDNNKHSEKYGRNEYPCCNNILLVFE